MLQQLKPAWPIGHISLGGSAQPNHDTLTVYSSAVHSTSTAVYSHGLFPFPILTPDLPRAAALHGILSPRRTPAHRSSPVSHLHTQLAGLPTSTLLRPISSWSWRMRKRSHTTIDLDITAGLVTVGFVRTGSNVRFRAQKQENN